MSGAIPPLSQYTFMARCSVRSAGITFPLSLLLFYDTKNISSGSHIISYYLQGRLKFNNFWRFHTQFQCSILNGYSYSHLTTSHYRHVELLKTRKMFNVGWLRRVGL
jgi:hypothetical protein